MSGAIQDGRVCLRLNADRGLVKRTKCGNWSTITRSSIWASEVTCPACLGEMAAGKERVDTANRPR